MGTLHQAHDCIRPNITLAFISAEPCYYLRFIVLSFKYTPNKYLLRAHLLCARHCSRCWGYNREGERQKFPLLVELPV